MDFSIGYLKGQKQQGHKEVRVGLSSQNIDLQVIVITYVLDLYYNFTCTYVFLVSEITCGIQWELERPWVYLVSFGTLNLILGMRYSDVLQD